MKKIPKSVIGKDIQINYYGGYFVRIHRVKDVQEDNIIIDGAGNNHHIAMKKVCVIFEPRSKKYLLNVLHDTKQKQDNFDNLDIKNPLG